MDTQTFWTSVGLIATALLVTTPLAHRAFGADRSERSAVHATGVLAALSFTIDAGVVAAAMTIPWLVVGIELAVDELRRVTIGALVRRPNLAVLGSLATWSWMAAGASWLTAHRLGVEPLGFDRSITLLTVGHFHVAGLGLTALLALTYRCRPGRFLLVAIWVHQAGMLTVAAGLTFSDHLEVVGAVMITGALGVWAVVAVRWIRDELRGPARILLGIAVFAWILPMALALGWALGPFLPEPVVTTFITMLRFHAALQTFGLVSCGLVALLIAGPTTNDTTNTTIDDNTKEAHHDVAHHTNV